MSIENDGESRSGQRLFTRIIHAGLGPDPTTGAILTPIFQTTTYVQEGVGRHKGHTYTRERNPTVEALERNLGRLEEALPAVCFSSGMAAITSCAWPLSRPATISWSRT